MMCEDRISMQNRRIEIIQGLKKLPGNFKLFVMTCLKLAFFCYWSHSAKFLYGTRLQWISSFLSIEQIKHVLGTDNEIHALAEELYQQKSLLVMGRGYNYATCLEGALVNHLILFQFFTILFWGVCKNMANSVILIIFLNL